MRRARGITLALWKLGRMYADGDGVAHDDLKAFEYFSRLADQHADESPDSPNAAVVSSAFVALGGYFLDGIKDTYVMANPDARRGDVQLCGELFQRLERAVQSRPPLPRRHRRREGFAPRRPLVQPGGGKGASPPLRRSSATC